MDVHINYLPAVRDSGERTSVIGNIFRLYLTGSVDLESCLLFKNVDNVFPNQHIVRWGETFSDSTTSG